MHTKWKPKNKQLKNRGNLQKKTHKKTKSPPKKLKDDTPPADSANKLALAEHDMATVQVTIVVETQEVHLDVKEEVNKAGGKLKSELVDSGREVSAKFNAIVSELKESMEECKAVNTEM